MPGQRAVFFLLRALTTVSLASSPRLQLPRHRCDIASCINATFHQNVVATKLEKLIETPTKFFNTVTAALLLTTIAFRIVQQAAQANKQRAADKTNNKSASIKSLQRRFLIVFWTIRCADWLQGPYFYEVFASKIINGDIISTGLVGKLFLTGFASAAFFGPLVGKASDQCGRKEGTLAFCLLYALGAASTKSLSLVVLFIGRVVSGIATSLMFSAPEAWLVAESQKRKNDDPSGIHLAETFGLAYAGDSIVAIVSGQLSGLAASHRGPTGPFELSILFLIIGAVMTAVLWEENVAEPASSSSGGGDNDENNTKHKATIKDALQVIQKNPIMLCVGAAQSLFEAAMYIFIVQWPPVMNRAIEHAYGKGTAVPYGAAMSCFMASCHLGSNLFRQSANMGIATEESTAFLLTVATLAMASATTAASSSEPSLASVLVAFVCFEACVGMYFPSLGNLRSKYVPDAHRSIIMNLFAIPLNALVVCVFWADQRLGVSGALGVSTGALNLAAMIMLRLHHMMRTSRADATTSSSSSSIDTPYPK